MTDEAARLMLEFAARTGLSSDRPERRYLWTDAFAVCNFLSLGRRTRDEAYLELGLRLVDRVHRVLGQHRPDDARSGWISGRGATEGAAQPTRAGLRIGKPRPERRPDEVFDPELEWERDGQYFHYLTRWMHALDQASRWTREPRYNVWARQLADTAHRTFIHGPQGARRLVWKMSIDLSHPLVWSMGQHDALDGLLTCVELEATAAALSASEGPSLGQAIHDFAELAAASELSTTDPLGLGGLLTDICRIEQLARQEAFTGDGLEDELVRASLQGLSQYQRQAELRLPASHRLAFRELGLAIGLAGIEIVANHGARFAELGSYLPLASAIRSFWLAPEHQRSQAWDEHRDIDEVMLATSLAPEGYLLLSS